MPGAGRLAGRRENAGRRVISVVSALGHRLVHIKKAREEKGEGDDAYRDTTMSAWTGADRRSGL